MTRFAQELGFSGLPDLQRGFGERLLVRRRCPHWCGSIARWSGALARAVDRLADGCAIHVAAARGA